MRVDGEGGGASGRGSIRQGGEASIPSGACTERASRRRGCRQSRDGNELRADGGWRQSRNGNELRADGG